MTSPNTLNIEGSDGVLVKGVSLIEAEILEHHINQVRPIVARKCSCSLEEAVRCLPASVLQNYLTSLRTIGFVGSQALEAHDSDR